jgi:hypothetical protein
MAADFTPNPEGIGAFLAGVEPALKELATGIVAEARQGPRNPRHRDHAVDYIAVGAFRVTAQGAEQDIDWPRYDAHLIEFGSAHNPPYRPLTRAVQNAGLELKDRGRH